MKNKYAQLLLILLLSILLTACSAVDKEAVSLYKHENALEIDVVLPESVSINKPQLFKVYLSQGGNMVDAADYVHFTFWNNDNSNQPETIVATNDGNGVYSVEKTIGQQGLYYVKVHASANGSSVMPTKQFIAGELSKEQLDSLQKGSQDKEQNHDQHH